MFSLQKVFNQVLKTPHFFPKYYFSQLKQYKYLKYEQRNQVGIIYIDRPEKLNALSDDVTHELNDALETLDADESVGTIVLTGKKEYFASGADIHQMKDLTYPETYLKQLTGHWEKIDNIKKPIIGAISGYTLGGGCIYAMLCDIIIAGDNTKIGIPVMNLGICPTGGATQWLAHLLGKSKAMELILTGRRYDAHEAKQIGLVNYVVPADVVVDEAVKLGDKISKYSRHAVAAAKDCVKNADNLALSDGIRYEKQAFWSTFATKDQKEGMQAFAEKREPKFTNS